MILLPVCMHPTDVCINSGMWTLNDATTCFHEGKGQTFEQLAFRLVTVKLFKKSSAKY